jgi:hypothetical protein
LLGFEISKPTFALSFLNPFVWGVVEMDDYEVEELMLVALVIVLIQAIFQTLPSFKDDEFLLNYALKTVDDRVAVL